MAGVSSLVTFARMKQEPSSPQIVGVAASSVWALAAVAIPLIPPLGNSSHPPAMKFGIAFPVIVFVLLPLLWVIYMIRYRTECSLCMVAMSSIVGLIAWIVGLALFVESLERFA
jgi:hypothetical protein